MLSLVGQHGDGWWPTGSEGPEAYGAKLAVIREAAERAGRDVVEADRKGPCQ